MEEISKELREIRTLITPVGTSQGQSKPQRNNQHRDDDNVWFDSEKLANSAVKKAKPAEVALVVNKADDIDAKKSNTKMVENAVIDSNDQVKKSFKDKKGNLIVVCKSMEARDALKNKHFLEAIL